MVLYFSEGLPYGIVREFVPMYLRFHGVDLTKIGLLTAVGYAWTLKFFWSPLVDIAGTYRRWIGGSVLAIGLALAGMAASPNVSIAFYALVALLALASGTQDIAVDAFTIRATPAEMFGPINSIRVTAYRIALTVPGLLGAIAQKFGWSHAFGAAAVAAAIIFLVTLTLPDTRGAATAERPNIVATLRQWMRRPRAGALLAIVFLYRLGELAIVPMTKPFWADRHYSPAEIGLVTSTIGVVISIAGAIAGGAFVARFGLYRGLLWLGILQTVANLGYAIVATVGGGHSAIWIAAVPENFGYGLGTAAFLAFLMSLCDRERAATEYALLSAAYGLTGTTMAAASGWIAQHAGYAAWFWITVALGVPSLLLLPRVRSEIAT